MQSKAIKFIAALCAEKGARAFADDKETKREKRETKRERGNPPLLEKSKRQTKQHNHLNKFLKIARRCLGREGKN